MELETTRTEERKVVTFQEVHEELEHESMFLKKAHDIEGYTKKARFLNGAGFYNSIAAKLYSSISENSGMIDEYERKYHGQYRFILKPQLERICEKYNLFVRSPHFFLGDIPEENIKEMMNFKVHLEDLDFDINNDYRFRIINENNASEFLGTHKRWIEDGRVSKKNNFFTIQNTTFDRDEFLVCGKVRLDDLSRIGFDTAIQIAAVESLFEPSAFEETRARIPQRAEIAPINQVDMDPIVLCETKHGYIIITAWGDEANDELVVNPNKN